MSGNKLKNFATIKEEGIKLYKQTGAVYCPYFQTTIAFNAKGLEHLKFNRHNHARPKSDQLLRFKLLYLAPQVLKLSHTLQGFSSSKSLERVKINNRWEYKPKHVTYYEFVAILEEVRVRVIVKQVEGGEKFFWSIVPFWRIKKNQTGRAMHSGRPETD